MSTNTGTRMGNTVRRGIDLRDRPQASSDESAHALHRLLDAFQDDSGRGIGVSGVEGREIAC